jgi:hypothetical protein
MFRWRSPVRDAAFRGWATLLVASAAAALLCYRAYRDVVPSGASFTPYTCYSVVKGVYSSPGGRHRVRVVYNDAGAMHSGNHWTWLVTDHWLTGKRVVAQGYRSAPEIWAEPFEINWVDEDTCVVSFLTKRHGGESRTVQVTLQP